MTARAHRAHLFGLLGVTILLNACGSDVPAGPFGPDLRRGTGGATTAVGGHGSGGSTAGGGSKGAGDPGTGGAGGPVGGGAGVAGVAGVAGTAGGGSSGGSAGPGGSAGSGSVAGSTGGGGHASGGAGGLGAAGGAGASGTGGAGGRPEPGVGDVCGGNSANARGCAKGLFCEGSFPELACVPDVGGTCQSKPEVCTALYAPVCGCDRKTYSNDCVRRSAGVSKRSDGECPQDGGSGGRGGGGGSGGNDGNGGNGGTKGGGRGDACGGNAANARGCAKGLFCEGSFPDLTCVSDVGGTCQEVPSGCTKEYQPVCGCDCKTYGNECTRRAAGVSKRADGECASVRGC